jgi:hypothetical protein
MRGSFGPITSTVWVCWAAPAKFAGLRARIGLAGQPSGPD